MQAPTTGPMGTITTIGIMSQGEVKILYTLPRQSTDQATSMKTVRMTFNNLVTISKDVGWCETKNLADKYHLIGLIQIGTLQTDNLTIEIVMDTSASELYILDVPARHCLHGGFLIIALPESSFIHALRLDHFNPSNTSRSFNTGFLRLVDINTLKIKWDILGVKLCVAHLERFNLAL